MFARIARFVTRYPVQVILVWVLLVLLAIPAARLAPQRLAANASDVKNSEAQKVTQIYTQQFAQQPVDRTVLVSESTLPENDPRFRQVYDQLIAKIERLEGVIRLSRYDVPSPLQQQSADGRITATLLDTRLDNGEAVIEALRREASAAQTPEIRFYVTGATAVTKDFLHLLEADVKRSELMALPLTGLVLLLAFGALVATGLPLMVGVVAIATGLADGLGLGENARAALVTRGLAEITRLGVALGARAETFILPFR